jgi:hypothetical protein
MMTMGAGSWSAATYGATTTAKISSGTTFGYDRYARTTGKLEPHELLDPFIVAKSGVIESRDNADHPNSVPIIVGLDQTGSMGNIPRVVQKKLGGLFNLLLLRGYVEDPQIAIAAYGDCECDPIRTTVQFSQFESDNRIDNALDNLLLYGGGGGNGGESMTALWHMMLKVESDAWHKRGKKGYAFFVADEVALDLTPAQIKGFCGDDVQRGDGTPLTVKELAAAIQERWEVFILLIDNGAARMQQSEKFYKNLFGTRNVLVLEDENSVSETIALAVGVTEGTVDIDEAEDDLKDTGSNEVAVRSSVNAVRNSGLARLGGAGAVVKGGASLDLGNTGGGAVRL